MKIKSLVMIVVMFAMICAGCGMKNSIVTRPMDTPVINVKDLNPRATSAQLRQIIVSACSKYGWKVDSSSDSMIVATLTHHYKETVTVEIPFSPAQVSINYKNSTNMRAGDGKIHRSYNRWVRNLEVDIRNGIANLRN